jgi:predicted alpha/beta hydrolase family esterase
MVKNEYYLLVHGGESHGQRLRREVEYLTFEQMNILNEEQDYSWNLYFKHKLASLNKRVLYILMPYPEEAIYEEWEERMNQVLRQILNSTEIYLTGHSLGATFLQMFLCRNVIKQTVKQVNFVSPVVKEGDFIVDPNWGNILNQCKNNHIFHSIDDSIAPYRDGVKFKESIIGSELHTFRYRGHFADKEFPELIEHLLK